MRNSLCTLKTKPRKIVFVYGVQAATQGAVSGLGHSIREPLIAAIRATHSIRLAAAYREQTEKRVNTEGLEIYNA